MNICLFTDSFEPSGIGEHMLTLAAELCDEHTLFMVCPPTSHGTELLARAAALGVHVFPLEVRDDPAEQDAFVDWLRAAQVDLVHCHAGIFWEGHGAVFAARSAGVPIVLRTEHLPCIDVPDHQREGYLWMSERVDRMICVSEGVRSSYLALGAPEEKLVVVRNGIRLPVAAPVRDRICAEFSLRTRARIVLTVGRMTLQKGHRLLASSVPLILERNPDVHLLWVGDGPLEAELREYVHVTGLDEHVHFAGQRADIAQIMASVDLFVLPSLFEGFPLVMLEAMALSLPVVGTRVCGTTEAIVDGVTGRLVEPEDNAALADAIVEALARPEMMAAWASAARARVLREFTAARMAREIAGIYRELAKENVPLAGVKGARDG